MATSRAAQVAACVCGGLGRALSAEEIIVSFGDLPVISGQWMHLSRASLRSLADKAATCGCPLTQWALARGVAVSAVWYRGTAALVEEGVCARFIATFVRTFDSRVRLLDSAYLSELREPHARAGAEAAVAVRAYLTEHGIDPERDTRHSGTAARGASPPRRRCELA